MFAILGSAFNAFAAWLFQAVILKAIVFTIFFFVVHELVEALAQYLTQASMQGVNSGFAALPAGAVWFMNVFRLDVGLPMILSAHATAFGIRRLPVIG